MKTFTAVLVFLAVVTGLVWLVWLQPPAQTDADPQTPTEVSVRVADIVVATLRRYVTAYGTVEPEPVGDDPAASARVAPAVPGVIVAVNCFEGQRVEKGAILVQLDSRSADVAVKTAEKILERQKRLIEVEGTSRKDLEAAEQQLAASRVQQALLEVRAPLSGTVLHVNARPGEAVDGTTTLVEVVDLDRLVVSAHVPSTELTALTVGQTAEVLADRSSTPIVGSLTYIGLEVDPRNDTAPVRVALPAGSGLPPGRFVTLRIVSEEHRDCLAVPVESVVKDEQGATVIALVDRDVAVRKPVASGLSDGGLVEVEADGLEPGMRVVTEGAYALPAETKVRVLGN